MATRRRKASTATGKRQLYSVWLDIELKEAMQRVREKDLIRPADQIRAALEQWLVARGALKRRATRGGKT